MYMDKIIQFILHKPLLAMMRLTRKMELKIIGQENLPDYAPVIYVVNHTNSHDIPIASEVIKKHHNVLLGKQPLRIIDKIVFCLNGVIWVDRKDKISKSNSKKKIIENLHRGTNILMFPEGTWNRTQNKIMLPLYWGCIDVAKISNVPLCPIVLDYTPDTCYAKIGKSIVIRQNDDKHTAITRVRDEMSTMRWELWETFPILNRNNIEESYFTDILEHDAIEYPKLDLLYEASVIRKEYDDTAFEHINKIEITKQNAFLFNKRLK